jgi:hypothetical protein
MNKLKRTITSLTALLLFSGVAMAAPGSGHAVGNSVYGSPPTSGQPLTSDSLAQQFRDTAKLKVQQAKLNGKTHSQAQRQQACTARKNNLEKRMSNAVSQAEKHKGVFDKIYSRVQDFYTTKNLNVADYSTLTDKVDAAQTDAQTSIDALKTLDISVDCTSQTVADSVSAFQQAVAASRDSLKTYRAALVDLINSLKGASTGAKTSDTGDTSTNTGQ